jgi:hypothetical protein
VIATLNASDEDKSTVLTYTLDDNDNGMFAVSGDKLTIDSTNYEKQKIHHVTVRVTDNGSPSMSVSKTFTIQVLDVNERPVKVTVVSCAIGCETYSNGYPRVKEDSVIVGIVQAYDPDHTESMTFNLTDDADGLFRISPSISCVASKLQGTKTVCNTTLHVAGELDFETARLHDIAVKVSDRKGRFIEDKFTVTVLDVNEAPTHIRLGNGVARVKENKKSGTIVGILTATDADSGQSHTFSISDPSSSFLVSGNVVKVAPSANLDYEVTSRYSVWITATDNGKPRPLSLTSPIVIEVEDVNEPPSSVSPRKLTVNENSNADTLLGKLAVTDPDNERNTVQSFSFKMVDSANGRFKIENGIVKVNPSNERCLKFGGEDCPLNYESKKLHTIWVQVTDNGTQPESTDFSIAVEVIDTNDQPRNLRLSNQKVNENSAIGHLIGMCTATDEDNNQTLSYELLGNAKSVFVMKQSQLLVNKPLDHEKQKIYNIHVKVTDNGSPRLSLNESFIIEVVNEYEPPISMSFVDSSGQLSFSANQPAVEENSVIGTAVGTIEARDPDVGEKMTFSLISNHDGLFSLSTSQGRCNNVSGIPGVRTACQVRLLVSGKLNYELKSQHDIAVSVNDSAGKILVASFTIKVRDINDAPTGMQLAGGNPVVTENRPAAVIGELVTTDEDRNEKFTYSLVSDGGGPFVIVNREVRLKDGWSVDYETETQFNIRVISTDNGSPRKSFEKNFTVKVLDVNEVPTDVSLSKSQVAENSGTPTQVGFLSTTDPDNAKHHRQSHTYRLVDDAGGRFEIVNDTVKVKYSNVQCLKSGGDLCLLNYEKAKSHRIAVEVKDDGISSLTNRFILTITVEDKNDQPRKLTVSNLRISENVPKGTPIGTVSAFDEDIKDVLSYTIISADGGNFNLSGNQLYSGRSEDFESRSSYTITLRVEDSGSPKMAMKESFTVTVTDVNEPPSSVSILSTGGQLKFTTDFPRINENALPGTVVGTVEVFDVDTYNGEGIAITFDDSADGRFRLATGAGVTCNSTTLSGYRTVCRAKIYVAKPLDYEFDIDHVVIIRASDKGGLGLFKIVNFTVSVQNVNDAPTDIDLANGSPQVKENVNGAVVGELVVTDQDRLQAHTCELLDDSGGRFVVINLEVRVSDTANLDYETQKLHTVCVKCTDKGTLAPPALNTNKSFGIKVLDVNERPTKIHISNDEVDENAKIFTVVGKLTASDPDNSHANVQTFKYKLLDNAGGRFKIDEDFVKVAVSNTKCILLGGKWCMLNVEAKNRYDIVVQTTDSGSPPLSITNNLTIDLRDINDRPRSLDLSTKTLYENERVVGRFTATDEDTQQNLEYILADSEDGKFEIVGDELRKVIPADYETAKHHTISVVVKDDGLPSLNISGSFWIRVLDVNEAPFNLTVVDDQRGDLPFDTGRPRVRENATINTTVGIVEVLDYDNNDTVFIELLDDDLNGAFRLDTRVTCESLLHVTGVNSRCFTSLLLVKKINFEMTVASSVRMRAEDKSGLSTFSTFEVEIVDVNDVPHDIDLSNTKVDENSDDTLIGCFNTVDEDATQNHTYTLSDDGQGKFVVKGNCLFTALDAGLNYEKQTEINVTVRSTDDGSPPLFREETYLITVNDVNEQPSNITVSNLEVEENSPIGSVVGVVSVDDPDNHGPKGVWQSHWCTLIDDARGLFVVERNTSILKVAVSDLNYEMNTTLNVVIRCTDFGTPKPLFRNQPFIILIRNVNEKPTKIVMQGGVSPENRQQHVIANFSTFDPDDETQATENFKYRLLDSDDVFPFAILGNQLVNTRKLNYEENPTWRITVVSTDRGNLSITETFQVNVVDVNDAPTGIGLVGSSDVPENSVAGTYVGSMYTMDQDASQHHTYRLLAVAEGVTNSPISQSPFSLEAETGLLIVSGNTDLDYEKLSLYKLQISTTDSGSPSYNYTGYVQVRIANVNEQPTNISLNGTEVFEDSCNGTVVGTLVVSDPDNANGHIQWHTCVVLRGSSSYKAPFQVVDNVTLIVSKASLDYEQTEFYIITIRCSYGNEYLDKTFSIRVIDVNEAPLDVSFIRAHVDENLPPGSLAGVATCRDPDNEFNPNRSSVVFVFETDGPFVLNGSDLLTTKTLDYELTSVYSVTLTAVDDGEPSLNTTVTQFIYVSDTNDPPRSIRLVGGHVKENSAKGTVVGSFLTDDEDCCQHPDYNLLQTYAATSVFQVIGNQLVVYDGNNLDYERTQNYTLSVRSTDDGNPPISVDGVIVVHVSDVNEPPTDIISYTVSTIEENAAAGTFVANLTVIDPDFNQSHPCELLNGSEYFSIVQGRSPKLFVSYGAQIDYEQNANIWVNIHCSDDGNPPLSVHHSFHVAVVDVNEPPTEISLDGKRVIPENKPVDTLIGKLGVKDPDKGQSHSYRVVGQWASAFKVVKRQLVVAKSEPFDFDLLRVKIINVTVSVSDDGTPSYAYNQTFSFNITDVNEPPSRIRIIGNGSIYENASLGEKVGQLSCYNPERNEDVTYDILTINGHNTSKDFYINGTTLYLNTTPQYENISTYELLIRALDDGIPPLYSEEPVSVTVKATDPCALQTSECHGNAICRRKSADSAKCDCIPGFTVNDSTGVCEPIDDCKYNYDANETHLSLCSNGGTCLDGTEDYTCLCPIGWTGRNCGKDIDECASNPCVHGYCLHGTGHYFCSCDVGFTGVNCETNIDDCATLPCGPGSCTDGIDDFTCSCPDSYEGYRCSFAVDACQDESCALGLTCVPRPVNPFGQAVVPQSSEPHCVPHYDITTVHIPHVDDNPNGDDIRKEFAEFVEINLDTIPTSQPYGDHPSNKSVRIFSVYIVHSEPLNDGLVVHFVVIVTADETEDLPVLSKYGVLMGLNYSCSHGAIGSHSDKFCGAVLDITPTLPQVPSNSPSIRDPGSSSLVDFLWPVIGCLLLTATIVGGSLMLRIWVRKKQLKRSSNIDRDGRSSLAVTELDEDGLMIASPIYDGAAGVFTVKDNPLYYEGDEDGVDYENCDPDYFPGMTTVNPIEDPELVNGVTYANPLFVSTAVGKTLGSFHNPLFKEAAAINDKTSFTSD